MLAASGLGYSAIDTAELKGAENVVIPKIDHRETAFSATAFAQMYRFITGHPPGRVDIVHEPEVVLNAKVNGMQGSVPTTLPVAGARVEIYEVSAATGARSGAAVHAKTTGADGLWGRFRAKPDAYYEFVTHAPVEVLSNPLFLRQQIPYTEPNNESRAWSPTPKSKLGSDNDKCGGDT